MIARRTPPLTWALVLAVISWSACAHEDVKPVLREFEFGARRVEVIVPVGWEALDQGQVKRFRKGEFEILLQYLGPATPAPRDQDGLIGWELAAVGAGVGHDQGREIKSRRATTVDGREAVDIETWSRLDHSNPQRIFLVRDDGDLLALRTERMAFEETLAAFDAIRDSLHFPGTHR